MAESIKEMVEGNIKMIYARLQGRSRMIKFARYAILVKGLKWNITIILFSGFLLKVNTRKIGVKIYTENLMWIFFSLLEDKSTYFKNMNIIQLLVVALIYRLFTPRNACIPKIYMYASNKMAAIFRFYGDLLVVPMKFIMKIICI
ncbi:MAG: hypothetical protein ACLTER_06195 [Ruminococcus sp.]